MARERPVKIVQAPDFAAYSEVIDVRSPAEFAEDHVPGAINCWVLDDAQRAEVGTIYKQVSPFEAKKRGAALVAANIGRWMATHFADKPRDYRPLVYCWRGGQRSMSLATVLARVGWEVHVMEGGYKRYRARVRETLAAIAPRLHLVVLAGLTGTAKTRLLHALRARGEQVLDLEGLARHRGSLLGHDPAGPQPAQKYFESLLARELTALDPARPVWVESESNKIGNLYCPEALWRRMKDAPVVEVTAPLDARVAYLLRDYPHFQADPAALKRRLDHLVARHGHATVDHWHALIDAGDWPAFVADLLTRHYDPSYRRSIARHARPVLGRVTLPALDEADIAAGAGRLAALLAETPAEALAAS